MAHYFLIYDFGTDEETAQQARRKLEGWKQGFRLGEKMLVKFERPGEETAAASAAAAEEDADAPEAKSGRGKKAAGAKGGHAKKKSATDAGEGGSDAAAERVRLFIRLDFSDHEKLSRERWLAQIPAAEPFKSAKAEIVRSGDAAFDATSELFDSLDRAAKGARNQTAS
ncbi:MAG TPA: hypothetical protein VN661_05550 [Candidatus Acidoferrales bacterium]|nr:hypothetical protein [Candidatus Acidoferrales bacterium]